MEAAGRQTITHPFLHGSVKAFQGLIPDGEGRGGGLETQQGFGRAGNDGAQGVAEGLSYIRIRKQVKDWETREKWNKKPNK